MYHDSPHILLTTQKITWKILWFKCIQNIFILKLFAKLIILHDQNCEIGHHVMLLDSKIIFFWLLFSILHLVYKNHCILLKSIQKRDNAKSSNGTWNVRKRVSVQTCFLVNGVLPGAQETCDAQQRWKATVLW